MLYNLVILVIMRINNKERCSDNENSLKSQKGQKKYSKIGVSAKSHITRILKTQLSGQ